ncbi:MAG TPA: extracellular solute-binding protein [Chloroflexota bacterium]|nr:extracellular solute-binding protein [Chloroflexota bacterium]
MRDLKFGAGLIALALGLAACGGSAAPTSSAPAAIAASAAGTSAAAKPAGSSAAGANLQQLIEGAKKESVLKGVWSESSFGGSQGFQEMVAAMNKKYGLNVKAQFTPGPDMQSLMGKIAQEVAAGQASTTDVYLGNSQAMQQAIKPNALKPIEWQGVLERQVPGEQGFDPVAPSKIGVAIATSVTGLTYSSKLIPENQVPHKLADLLDPKWKGKIASTPYAAGFRDFAVKDLLGKEFTIDYVRKLSKQVGGLIRCGEYDRMSSGEFIMLALDCGHDGAFTAQRQGAPISQVILDDATSLHMRYAGVPTTSSSPNAATLFIAFLETSEGQKMEYKSDGMDLHTFSDSQVKPLVDKVRTSGGKVWADNVQNLEAVPDYAQTQKELQDILQQAAK